MSDLAPRIPGVKPRFLNRRPAAGGPGTGEGGSGNNSRFSTPSSNDLIHAEISGDDSWLAREERFLIAAR